VPERFVNPNGLTERAKRRSVAVRYQFIYSFPPRKGIMRIIPILLAFTFALVGLNSASAQTNPSTAPAARHELTVPPGFVRLSISDREIICLPEDEAWVRQAVGVIQPATRPSTMPADLIQRAESARPEIERQIAADLGITDLAMIQALFDEKLMPMLRQFESLDPPLFYLATTRERLRDLVRDGWKDPRFHYNRVANDVTFNMSINFNIDGPVDDTVFPVLYTADETDEQKAAKLIDTIQVAEKDITDLISNRSQFLTQMAFVQFINDLVMNPLELPTDEAWIGLGISGYLSARYSSPILDTPVETLLEAMTFEHPRNPVKVATVDLLHPTPASELRERIVPIYLDAMRRKSTSVVAQWVAEAGEEAIPKTLAAIRANKPADGAALVKLIQETTGVDLTAALSAE